MKVRSITMPDHSSKDKVPGLIYWHYQVRVSLEETCRYAQTELLITKHHNTISLSMPLLLTMYHSELLQINVKQCNRKSDTS